MGNIKKIGDDFYIEFYARGLLYQQKAGREYSFAVKMLKEVEEKISTGEALTIVREVDCDIFFLEFLNSLKAQFSPKSIHRFEATVKHFHSYLKNQNPSVTQLSQVTPIVIEGYKNFGIKSFKESSHKFNPKKANLTLLLLREILDYGIKLGYINDNPSLHIRLLAVRTTPLGFVSDTQYNQVIKTAESISPNVQSLAIMKMASLQQKIQFSFFRNSLACSLLKRGISIVKVSELLELSDVAKIIRWASCIPLAREDVYLGAHQA